MSYSLSLKSTKSLNSTRIIGTGRNEACEEVVFENYKHYEPKSIQEVYITFVWFYS